MLGLPQNHQEGWRKEIEAKLLGKMPQTTLHAWPNHQTIRPPEFAVTTTTTAVSSHVASPLGARPCNHHPQSQSLWPLVTSTEMRLSFTWYLWPTEPVSYPLSWVQGKQDICILISNTRVVGGIHMM